MMSTLFVPALLPPHRHHPLPSSCFSYFDAHEDHQIPCAGESWHHFRRNIPTQFPCAGNARILRVRFDDSLTRRMQKDEGRPKEHGSALPWADCEGGYDPKRIRYESLSMVLGFLFGCMHLFSFFICLVCFSFSFVGFFYMIHLLLNVLINVFCGVFKFAESFGIL